MNNLKIMPEEIIALNKSLFGCKSRDSQKYERTEKEWKELLKKYVVEIQEYLNENIETDSIHMERLLAAASSSETALRKEDYLPLYIEGLIRLIFTLIGQSPEHCRRKGGRKAKDHYKLDKYRNICYIQDSQQKYRLLHFASQHHYISIQHMRSVYYDFCKEFTYYEKKKKFINWFKEKYSDDYLRIF